MSLGMSGVSRWRVLKRRICNICYSLSPIFTLIIPSGYKGGAEGLGKYMSSCCDALLGMGRGAVLLLLLLLLSPGMISKRTNLGRII